MTRYSREQLYDLVWSEPIKGLAKRFDLTDNGFRKRILPLNIPLPDRSYWAKANASKPKVKIKLPPRGPAQLTCCRFIGHRDWLNQATPT
jgi:hypothetical protein